MSNPGSELQGAQWASIHQPLPLASPPAQTSFLNSTQTCVCLLCNISTSLSNGRCKLSMFETEPLFFPPQTFCTQSLSPLSKWQQYPLGSLRATVESSLTRLFYSPLNPSANPTGPTNIEQEPTHFAYLHRCPPPLAQSPPPLP